MKTIALVSGGKDSCYNMMQCVAEGHEIVALANLKPKHKDELDSYMYQTVGHHAIELYAEAMGLPLFRRIIEGGSIEQGRDYKPNSADEVEDLYELLKEVKEATAAQGVSVGAILSDYQRVRVENVCSRLGLTSLAYLWRREQEELLKEMIDCQVNAVLIKVAALGLQPEKHLGASLEYIYPHMLRMKSKYGLNPCGEGGEYETFTLDCPLFLKKIVVDEQDIVKHDDDPYASVAYINFTSMHLEDKNVDPTLSQFDRIKHLPLKRSSQLSADLDLTENDVDKDELKPTCSSCVQNRLASTGSLHIKNINSMYYITGVYGCDGEDVEQQTRNAMESLKDALNKHSLDLTNIAAMHLYVSNMSQFHQINGVYKTYFGLNPPIRVCVGACLPENTGLQVDCIVTKSEKTTMHVQGLSHWAPANIGPYSQAVKVENCVFVAGQIAMQPSDLSIIPGGIICESRLSLRHVQHVLSEIQPGCSLNNVTSVICYVTSEAYVAKAESEWNRALSPDADLDQSPKLLNWVVVPALPKAAKVEWQVRAYMLEDKQDIESLTLVKSLNSTKAEIEALHLDKIVVALNIKFSTNQTCILPDLLSLMNIALESLEEQLKIGSVRMFFRADLFQLDAILATYTYESSNIAVQFIPVLRFQSSDCVALLCL